MKRIKGFLLILVSMLGALAFTSASAADSDQVAVAQYGVATFDFEGPELSEDAADNPFTNYILTATFRSAGQTIKVRGFFAADGNAAETSADSGEVWRVHFSPPTPGEWQYQTTLLHGEGIAFQKDPQGRSVPISSASGRFMVGAPKGEAPDFRARGRGRLIARDHYLRFRDSGYVWLKGGANSPENLLAYEGFDGTYRQSREARPGDVTPDQNLHRFAPHLRDWREGDADWKGGAGKGIVGAMNYLADRGMNSVYFLTMNIGGDGNDVWPYRAPDDFTRFDVSKLDQWNILFNHMQAKGILLHIVLQETENELLLDEGDLGDMRRLYLSELIARFAHHNGLVWNLGEENGPVSWMPEGQSDDQRRAMAQFLEDNDPYGNTVLLHTHAGAEDKDHIAGPLLGEPALDGLSLQIGDRRTVFGETARWRKKSDEASRPWVLTMDEIGMWHTGAPPDAMAAGHDSLRRHVLWGHLLAGGAGVEWYFGYNFPGNDLTAEDWRSRDDLWRQTKVALDFFTDHVAIDGLVPCADGVSDRPDSYCARDGRGQYVIYLPDNGSTILSIEADMAFDVFWFDPKHGSELQRGTAETVQPGGWMNAGAPPTRDGRDWVMLLRPGSQD